MRIEDAIEVLERTPATLAAMLSGVSETWARSSEGEGKWTPYDVIGHLVHGEQADWIPRVRHILEERSEPFPTFDRTAMFRESAGKSLDQLLGEFAEGRAASLQILRGMNLAEADLARESLHPQLGRVNLEQLIASWVVHDLDHIAQIARTMAKIYTDDVGPWRAYLGVLEDRR